MRINTVSIYSSQHRSPLMLHNIDIFLWSKALRGWIYLYSFYGLFLFHISTLSYFPYPNSVHFNKASLAYVLVQELDHALGMDR